MLDQVSPHSRPHIRRWTDIENVFPALQDYREQQERYVLVTLVGIDGGSPRPVGAQMAVSESGQVFGHISGGCLKAEIVRQSQDVLRSGENRVVRYGKGSPYMDIVLPCGSGLDLHFDCRLDDTLITDAISLTSDRTPFSVGFDLELGTSRLITDMHSTVVEDTYFYKSYLPVTRLVVAGTDPAVIDLAKLAQTAGFDVSAFSQDTDIIEELAYEQISAFELPYGRMLPADSFDSFTACAFFYHDLTLEIPLLQQVLGTSCFYIGAQGSRRTHRNRVEALLSAGVSHDDAQRIQGPLGLISKTRSPGELAISTLAEIVQCSRTNVGAM